MRASSYDKKFVGFSLSHSSHNLYARRHTTAAIDIKAENPAGTARR
jgi:hypothetical protein